MRGFTRGLLALLAAAMAAQTGGCALFGSGELSCQSDENCPSGEHCFEGRCAQDVVDAGGVGRADAAGGDASHSSLPIITTCDDPPCSMTPDSPTQRCANAAGGQAVSCPAEGEALYGQDGSFLIYALDLVEDVEGVLLERVSGLRWELDAATDIGWEAAHSRCEDLSLAGLVWRLPSLHELVSLLDYGRTASIVDARFAAAGAWFWSATGYDGYHWGANLGDGSRSGVGDSFGVGAARCVSGTAREVDGATFQFLGGDAARWRDARTSLEWRPESTPDQGWLAALSICRALDLDGVDDWRLPSVKELETWVAPRPGSPMTYPVLLQDTEGGRYWSSTPCAHRSGVWSINFSDGLDSCLPPDSLARVRCVRGPEP